MNKGIRPDIIWFNSFIITVLCVFAVILLRFEVLDIFFAFGIFGIFLLTAVFHICLVYSEACLFLLLLHFVMAVILFIQ